MMTPRIASNADLGSLSHGGNGDIDGQEVYDHWEGDGNKGNEDKKSSNGASKEKEGNEVDTTKLGH